MRDLKIASCQFEHRDGDKGYNLSVVKRLAEQAVFQGAEVVAFHECCLTGYAYLQDLSREQFEEMAEQVPEGRCCLELCSIATKCRAPVLAGLIELDPATGKMYNTYVCATPDHGIVARHRKLHAFINPHISCGESFTVFDLLGCRCGILICYDNNIVENVRVTALMGAEILFAPHVTGCADGPKSLSGLGDPRRFTVDPTLWGKRDIDPVPLRRALTGLGRDWLMRWLPSRAYDNALFVVFANPIGLDNGVLRNGNSMILDPFGEVLSECVALGDDVCVALCAAEKIAVASGSRYLRARRPQLYGKLTEIAEQSDAGVTIPGWKRRRPNDVAEEVSTVSS